MGGMGHSSWYVTCFNMLWLRSLLAEIRGAIIWQLTNWLCRMNSEELTWSEKVSFPLQA